MFSMPRLTVTEPSLPPRDRALALAGPFPPHARVLAALVTALAAMALAAMAFPPAVSAQVPTLRSIVIDGNLDDWQAVLVNPVQVTRDADGSRIDCAASLDLDCPIPSTGRDLRLFAWTHDYVYLYLLARRQGSSSNAETFWIYMDLDGDELMGATDVVLRVRHSGGNQSTDQTLFGYVPADPAGEPMVDVNGSADGHDMAGTAGPSALWSEGAPDGGTPDGTTFEERVPWSVLGVPPGTLLNFHVSSSVSSNPGSDRVDNLGALGGGLGTLAWARVSVAPDRQGTTAGGAEITYAHAITNTGTQAARFAFLVESFESLVVRLYHDTDGDGDGDVLVATDAAGDGDFTDVGDSIEAGWDTDGDAVPETPLLAPGATFHVVLALQTPPGASDLVDVMTLTAYLPADPVRVRDTAVDTTHVGPVVVRFDTVRGTVAGQSVSFPVQVCNNGVTDTFALSATSSPGLIVELHADPACDGTSGAHLATDADGDGAWDTVLGGDSDGDGAPDTGSLAAGACACFVLEITPDPSLGNGDAATVFTATGTATTGTATAELATRVSSRIELRPEHLVADGTQSTSGVGKPVFFAHVAVNNGATFDMVDFATVPPVNDQGWTVRIWSDPDGDGSIADGEMITRTGFIAPHGGTFAFVVEVEIPLAVAPGQVSKTVVTGASYFAPTERDTVVDEVVVSLLSTYSDPLYAFATQFFAPCDTIYVQGSGLAPPRGGPGADPYDLVYVDGAGRTVRFFAPFIPDDEGDAFDTYVIAPGDVAGAWSIDIREGGDTIATLGVTIETRGVVTQLATDRARYPLTGAGLTITTGLRSDNLQAVFYNSRLEHVVLDPAGSSYLDAASGTFRPYSGCETTRSIDLPAFQPAQTFTDQFTVPAVTYPAEGVYSVVARWTSSCGSVLVSSRVTFVVGSLVENCANGLDDDGDGAADCADPECALDPACFESDCDNGLDDDGDSLVDCADPDCAAGGGCPEVACANGLDDDGDTLVDCADPDCATDPACIEPDCTNGLDDDGDGLVDCDDPDCSTHPACLPETLCSDGLDNDQDTLIDCDDTDCVLDPACANDDTDGDGVPNGEDCAPLDPGSHHLPDGNLLDLMVFKRPPPSTVAVISWTSLSAQAGDATVYDITSGLVHELWDDRGFVDADGDGQQARCLASIPASTSYSDSRQVPFPPDAFWYLVRARNACGDSGWGQDSNGAARVLPAGLCP